MPHQCLLCGSFIQDSASLRHAGCPTCGGHRFFYTRAPMPVHHSTTPGPSREDVTTKVMNLIIDKEAVLRSGHKKYDTVESTHLHELVEQKLQSNGKSCAETDPPGPKDIRTIDIEQPGKYSIDVKGLLEREPIVIQKDGAYTIHLPSAFQQLKRKP